MDHNGVGFQDQDRCHQPFNADTGCWDPYSITRDHWRFLLNKEINRGCEEKRDSERYDPWSVHTEPPFAP